MAQNNGKWLNNVARLIKKANGGYFLKFARPTTKDGKPIGDNPFPMTIQEGDVFQAKLKRDDLQSLIDKGIMSEEVADKICATVKFEFSKAPSDGTTNKGFARKSDGNDDGEVNF